MKLVFKLFANLFAGLVGKLFIVANLVICFFAFDWSKCIRYLETSARINCHIKQSGGGIDFSSCGYFYYSPIEAAFTFVGAVVTIIFLPPILMTQWILSDLQKLYPSWCVETFDILYVPVFTVINSFYCLFLGNMIEKAHSAHLQSKPVKKPLSIFNY